MVLAKLHPFWVGKHFDFLKTLGKSHVWAHAHTRCLDNAAGAAMHGVPVLLLYWGSLFHL